MILTKRYTLFAYSLLRKQAEIGSTMDDSIKEQLKSLGYIH